MTDDVKPPQRSAERKYSVLKSFASPEDIDLSDITEGRLDVACDGVVFPIYLKRDAGKQFVVFLAGAVNRKTMPLPVFSRWNWGPLFPCNTVSIADPTLALSEKLTLAWYIGTRKQDYTLLLARLVKQLAQKLDVATSNIIFYASSGGGFAALMCARHIPGAKCVIVNPQIDIANYYKAHRQILAEIFAPDITFRRMRRRFGERLSVFEAFPRTEDLPLIFYAQNRADTFHFREHFTPFCETYGARIEGGFSENCRIFTKVFDAASNHGPEPREMIRPLIEESLAVLDQMNAST